MQNLGFEKKEANIQERLLVGGRKKDLWEGVGRVMRGNMIRVHYESVTMKSMILYNSFKTT